MARLSLSGLIALAALAGPLAGCGGAPPPPQTFADLRFTTEPPLRLAVAAVEINDEYRPNLDPPHYEQRMPIPLPHVVDNWARDRLQAAGASGHAVAVVTDASVVEIVLPKESGLSSTFTDQLDRQYVARAGVRVELRDDAGRATRVAEGHAERSITTNEGNSLNDRDRLLYQMEGDLMADLDRQLETQIRNNFGNLVR